MATKQKKPSKIIFCQYVYPHVEELGEFYSSKLREAANIVDIQNQVIAPTGGKLDNKFYFLNATIGKETHIITKAGQKYYPSNDPAIVAKLEAYLAGLEQQEYSSAHKHSTFKQIEQAVVERLSERTYLAYAVPDIVTADKVLRELKEIYRDKMVAKYIVFNKQHTIKVTSWYLTETQLRGAIENIINSQ